MSEAEQRPAFIGVDWGTSSFRAWLFDHKGNVLDLVQGPFGIKQITGQAFEKTLQTACTNHKNHLKISVIDQAVK